MKIGPIIQGVGYAAGVLAKARQRRREIERQDQADEDARAEREIRRAALLAGLRDQGVVHESEVGDNPAPKIEGKSLDELVNSMSTMPGVGTYGQRDVQTPPQYTQIGKTSFMQDRTRTKEAQRIAQDRKEKQDLDRRVSVLRARSPELKTVPLEVVLGIAEDDVAYRSYLRSPQSPFSERNTQGIQQRIRELVDEGVPIEEANRRARLEAGSSAPRLEDRVNGRDPGGVDRRKKITETRAALSETNRQLRDARKALPRFATAADSARVGPEINRLQQRRDSIQTEYDRQSAALPTGSSSLSRHGIPASPAHDTTGAGMQAELIEARKALDASLKQPGVDSAQARALYRRIVAAIRGKYSQE